jgi:hypothetical protein
MPSPTKKVNKKPVTRYGPVGQSNQKFGTEERFAWQNAQFSSDVVYVLPSTIMDRSSAFGSGARGNLDQGEAAKSSTGPGSYTPGKCFDHVSDSTNHHAMRFADAPRQSMDMKTISPGPVYNIEKTYWNGKDKGSPISFNCDHRKPLHEGEQCTKDADMFSPKAHYGAAITMAGKWKEPPLSAARSPGPVYDVAKKQNFKTGPSFSFGRGRGDRFAPVGMLKEFL